MTGEEGKGRLRPDARQAICADWKARPIFWSTVAYARQWWATDGINVQAVARNGMTAPVLRRIAIEYNVNRGIRGGGIIATELAQALNRASAQWPPALRDRATCCKKLVEQTKHCLHGEQASAVTKLMWFLRPERWTVFDRFAAEGAGISPHHATLRRMALFYEALAAVDFEQLCNDMQLVLAETPFARLPASRVIDALLMARGGRGGDAATVADLETLLTLLPDRMGAALHDLGGALQARFGGHALTVAEIGRAA